jgi:hypothetical protein
MRTLILSVLVASAAVGQRPSSVSSVTPPSARTAPMIARADGR